MLKSFFEKIATIFDRNRVSIKNIKDSTVLVTIAKWAIFRAPFSVTQKWFDELLKVTYDDEIKHKYIPELHQTNEFERESLADIVDFTNWKNLIVHEIKITKDAIAKFASNYHQFYQYLSAEHIQVVDPSHPSFSAFDQLNSNVKLISQGLQVAIDLLEPDDKALANLQHALTPVTHPLSDMVSWRESEISSYFSKAPTDRYQISTVFRSYNHVYSQLQSLNLLLSDRIENLRFKIIAGNAGTGKTHLIAHLLNKIQSNGEYVLFFKPKNFNGDNVDLEERLLKLMQIPIGYTMDEILKQLNDFSAAKKKRCFIIIDALNETTTSSVGFSPIWRNCLQLFINKVKQYPFLYFVCSLRISYLNNIWNVKPPIEELRGLTNEEDIEAAAEKYFAYYRIKVTNFHTADLTYFKVPLLLDLFCKFTNQARSTEKSIELSLSSYRRIFEEYVENLIAEVQTGLNLLKTKVIREGFTETSKKFLANKEAVITLDEFTDSFDKDDLIATDRSISRRVLEGYLIFIKDMLHPKVEIVKHTQQEIGGYLLAKYLCDKYSSATSLVQSSEYNEQLVSPKTAEHHQLRLDILKFLIAMRPEIVVHFKDDEALGLGWWFVFNGLDKKSPDSSIITQHLLAQVKNDQIDEILEDSANLWFNPESDFNWEFTVKIFEKMNGWDFNNTWVFFIYKNAEQFLKFLQSEIELIRTSDSDVDERKNALVAKFAAFVTATTARELRDIATVYLIEYGKKDPIRLLELTEYVGNLSDSYIYERVVSCCYGVSLIMQNDTKFVQNELPVLASRLYDRQFNNKGSSAVLNYIVIDSIKHLVDLALLKKVFSLDDEKLAKLKAYSLSKTYDWIEPSVDHFKAVSERPHYSFPEPIGSDFGIYTIPRLINDEVVERNEAVTNVYKRVYELGYKDLKLSRDDNRLYRGFFYGDRSYRDLGKVDRLGKKYSWLAFFDYAGHLLQHGKLNVFDKNEYRIVYDRLSDVDIDISLPSQSYKLPHRFYQKELIPDPSVAGWTQEVKIDSLKELFVKNIEGQHHILLHGVVEEKLDAEYKTRSYLLAETWFIKRTPELEFLKESISGQNFDWDLDIRGSLDMVRHTYFGELYWSDSVVPSDYETIFVPTGKQVTYKRRLGFPDVLHDKKFSSEDIGKLIDETGPEKIGFESEPTLTEYLWESDSSTIPTFSELVPAIRFAKRFGLKADPSSGRILDNDLNECYQVVEVKEGKFENDLKYLRSDLVRTYMKENDLAILVQVKQHSYEKDDSDMRALKVFVIESDDL